MKAESISQGSSQLFWIKSSYSSEEGGECVEVAACPHAIHVRDSKDTDRPGMTVGLDAWAMFVRHAVCQIG